MSQLLVVASGKKAQIVSTFNITRDNDMLTMMHLLTLLSLSTSAYSKYLV